MKHKKKDLLELIIIIVIIVLIFFLPNIIDLIPSREIKHRIASIAFILIFILMIYEALQNIRNNRFTTSSYIIITEIILIVSYLFMTYSCFKGYKVKNIDEIIHYENIRIGAQGVFLCSSMVLSFLKSERFKKKQS
jgi:hypothetical protein